MQRGRAWVVVHVGFAVVLMGVAAFSVFHSDDRDPYQWGSAIVCGFTWLSLPLVWVIVLTVQLTRRRQRAAQGFDVVVKPPVPSSSPDR
jgi:hypothetical protein